MGLLTTDCQRCEDLEVELKLCRLDLRILQSTVLKLQARIALKERAQEALRQEIEESYDEQLEPKESINDYDNY